MLPTPPLTILHLPVVTPFKAGLQVTSPRSHRLRAPKSWQDTLARRWRDGQTVTAICYPIIASRVRAW